MTDLSLREKLHGVLIAYAIEVYENQGLHSWRCEYYEKIDGPCDCVDRLLDDLVAAVQESKHGDV